MNIVKEKPQELSKLHVDASLAAAAESNAHHHHQEDSDAPKCVDVEFESNLLSIFNDSPPRLIRKTLEDVKKNAEVEYRKRVQTEMTQYIKLTGPKQGKSSHPSPKDIGTETLNFWRSLHPTAPTADDRASAGKFWGKPCDQWPSLWLHALIAQEALTVMSSSAPTVCKVVSFVVDRPKKVNGVMIGDGEIMLRLKWLNGPAVFMARNAKKYPE